MLSFFCHRGCKSRAWATASTEETCSHPVETNQLGPGTRDEPRLEPCDLQDAWVQVPTRCFVIIFASGLLRSKTVWHYDVACVLFLPDVKTCEDYVVELWLRSFVIR